MMLSKNSKNRSAHGSESDARKFFRYITLTLYGLVVVWGLTMASPGDYSHDWGTYAAGFWLSLCSMAALWSACFLGHVAYSSAGFTVAMLIGWWLLTRIHYTPFGDESELCWAITVTAQGILTVCGVSALDSFSTGSRRKFRMDEISGALRRRFTFRIETMIWWTTFAGLGIFAFQYLLRTNGWGVEKPTFNAAVVAISAAIVGATNAVIWLAVFRGAIWRVVAERFFISLAAILVLALLQLSVTQMIGSYYSDITTPFRLMAMQWGIAGLTLMATLNHTRR